MNIYSYDGGFIMEERYSVDCCDYIHTHDDVVERVRQEMPDEDTLYDLTELFRIFGDSTRIRILYVLFEAEMCVCDIAMILDMTQSAISHQLRALKNARLVKGRREGKTVFYSLADDHVKTIIHQGLDHVAE
jgi:ArsR family transcriptional regulator